MPVIINPHTKHIFFKPVKQTGGLTIAMALILLALSLGSAMYTAKTKLFDIRIAASDLRKAQAINSAEAGVEHALARLDADSDFSGGPESTTVGSNTFVLTVTPMVDGLGEPLSHPNWENDSIVQITSVGQSADGATRTIETKAWVHSIARSAPDSAITVSGGMGIGGSFKVGANPNGGGRGVPLSVWSDSPVTLSGNGATCGLEEFDNNECDDYPYSDSTGEGADVFEDSVVPAGTFPADLLEYTFGVPTSQYTVLRDQADSILTDCSTLDATSTGLIWVTGDCTINAGEVVGSATDPVVLIIQDSDLQMNGGAIIYGLVFTFESSPGLGGSISMTGNAVIRGAMIADHQINLPSGTFDTRYDADILAIIADENNQGDAFTKPEIIPGSWKDF